MPVELQLAHELTQAPDLPQPIFEQALDAVRAATQDPLLDGDVCVRICTAAESRQLNANFRGKDKPTNVLSFPADIELPGVAAPLGDLAICWSVVAEEADAQGKPVQDHLVHLFVHGVLHLLGYDHEESAQAEQMEALEVRILQNLRIPDPYRA